MGANFEAIPDWDDLGLPPESNRWRELAERLAEADGKADEAGVFPEDIWAMLVEAGATRWALPALWESSDPGRVEVLRRYARVAEGSLVAAFILTQHDAAVRRLVAAVGPGRDRANHWLGRISDGTTFATVGISQLTTSRRHGPQAMRVRAGASSGYVMDGAMPWVTAAERADLLVTGGVLDDGRQILAALPGDREGVIVHPAFDLAALGASRTSEVECKAVTIADDEVLVGPSPDVMATPGLAGTGGLETSALALGQARSAIAAMAELARDREDLRDPVGSLGEAWRSLALGLIATAEARDRAKPAGEIRAEANALVLRATQAFLTARKGSGFVRSEPAQRWARQALFFLVWSCPTPVAQAAIRDLAGICSP